MFIIIKKGNKVCHVSLIECNLILKMTEKYVKIGNLSVSERLMNFINEEECIGVKNEGGLITKAIREVEIMCLAGNIPESIDVDVINLELGSSIRLTEVILPEGSEIPGLTDETDQMVVSVNAPKAIEEEPIIEEGDEAEMSEEGASEENEGSDDDQSNEDSENEGSQEN